MGNKFGSIVRNDAFPINRDYVIEMSDIMQL